MVLPTSSNPTDPPDLTNGFDPDNKDIVGTTNLSVVYRCSIGESEVAVKAIVFPAGFNATEKEEFVRKVRRELGIWRRLNHPNIVQFLGTASGRKFGSSYDCIVSTWMTNGTLLNHINQSETTLSLSDRVKLIKGSVAGLGYLHSEKIIHGDLHPGNILIDDKLNARLTDFGLSQTLSRGPDQLAYLYTNSVRPGAALWAAPELLYPNLYRNLDLKATLESDIYSLGSIIFYVLSSKYPWQNSAEAEREMKMFRNPQRPAWPISFPDSVWDFIGRCWCPKDPGNRPPIREVSSFCADDIEKLYQPNVNVVIFGTSGSGKSSIVNLLAGKEVAQISPDSQLCTQRPRGYTVPIDGILFRLWDTMEFFLPHEGPISHLLPYERAHVVLRNLPEGVNLILLCMPKDQVTSSFCRLYWLMHYFFYDGHAPIALVVTDSSSPDTVWWNRSKSTISQRLGDEIPIESVPFGCISMDPNDSEKSKNALRTLLQTHAASRRPIPLRPIRTEMSADLSTHCGLTLSDAVTLVGKFIKPLRPLNVVFFGNTCTGMGSITKLVAGHLRTSKWDPCSYRMSVGMQQLRVWDSRMDPDGGSIGHDAYKCGQASENAVQLIRKLSHEGGVDLLVFCARFDRRLTREELASYKALLGCTKRIPTAAVVTRLEPRRFTKKSRDKTSKYFAKILGRKIVGRACIPPLNSDEDTGVKLEEKLMESRLSIERLLGDCVSRI